MQYLITPLLEVLNPTNTISRNRLLSFAIGNIEAEIYNCLIAKHVYYNNQGKLHEGGWFYSTVMDLHLSSGYAEDAQKTAIRHLIKHGLIESELKGLPAKRYFRIIPDAEKLTLLIESGQEVQNAIAQRYKDELEKRSRRRKNQKRGIIEISPDTVQADVCSSEKICSEDKSEAVTNPNSVSGVDDTDSVWVIGNSGDISEETKSYIQNPCSVVDGGTRSAAATGEIKDNKNQSNCFSNHSFSPQAQEKKFSADGIERQNESNLSFLEIIAEMGLDLDNWHYIYTRAPTSEKDLIYVDEDERKTKELHIPEHFRSDRNVLLTALRYLAAYSNFAYDDEMKPTANKHFIDITLKMLCELIMADSFMHNGRAGGYSEVLETLNELIREDHLYEFILSFQYEWGRILREDGGRIRSRTAYMKSCLWDWLKRWKIEEYNLLASLD